MLNRRRTDEGDTGTSADVRNDRPASVEVVQDVRHDGDVVLVHAEGIEVTAAERGLVVAVNAFDLDPRADEVVTDHAARGPAELRILRAGLTEPRGRGAVEHPVPAALDAGIETRILERLRLRRDWQSRQDGSGN